MMIARRGQHIKQKQANKQKTTSLITSLKGAVRDLLPILLTAERTVLNMHAHVASRQYGKHL